MLFVHRARKKALFIDYLLLIISSFFRRRILSCSDYDARSTILTMIYWWGHDSFISSNVQSTAISDNELSFSSGIGLKPALLREKTEVHGIEQSATYVGFALVHLRGTCRTFHLLDLPRILHLTMFICLHIMSQASRHKARNHIQRRRRFRAIILAMFNYRCVRL